MDQLRLEVIRETRNKRGIVFPADIAFRTLLITGPPGSGKTTLINRIGGWPEEGYVDLTFKNWWAHQSLSLRPREIHMGFPFVGFRTVMSVFEKEWVLSGCPIELDYSRIRLPPFKRFFFSVDWRKRYVFEFLLPDAKMTLKRRQQRARLGTHPVDAELDIQQVERQLRVFQEIARYLHRNDIRVYVRKDIESLPLRIIE